MAKNLSIVAQGISGDERHLLGYNVTDNGIYTPAIGDVARDTTATYVAQDGTIKTAQPNVARVDYTNGVAELLLEPTSTNLITYSEDFSDSSWTKSNTNILPSQTISPNGLLNGYKLVASNTNNSHYIRTNATSSSESTISFFVKKAEEDVIFIGNATSVQGAEFDLTNGVVNSVSSGGLADIVHYGNGWYKCSYTRDVLADWQYLSIRGNFETYQGDGVSGVYIWGAQLEALPYATSYISTNGAIATRGADSLTNFGSEQIIDSESGILFFEGSFLPSNDRKEFGLFKQGDAVSRQEIYVGDSGTAYCSCRVNDVTQFSESIQTTTDSNFKLALYYKSGGYKFVVNGIEKTGNSNVVNPQGTLNAINFAYVDKTSFPFYGRVRQLKHLPYNTDITTL